MIRNADMKDYDRIIEMLVNFANAAPLSVLNNPQYDVRRVKTILQKISQNGCVLVAEDRDKTIQGMLIAAIDNDIWMPHIKTLRELAWWVEPDYRHTTLGYRLLMEYVKVGKRLKAKEIIHNFTLTNLSISPNFDLVKRGWGTVETNYVYQGD